MNHKHLYSAYQRIKNNCCKKWKIDSRNFYKWYEKQLEKQNRLCEYCHLPGNTEAYYQTTFRKGRRGLNLEVDRKNNKELYSPPNCVLACYPCNNAKSDVFSYEEFRVIGETIRQVKQQ